MKNIILGILAFESACFLTAIVMTGFNEKSTLIKNFIVANIMFFLVFGGFVLAIYIVIKFKLLP